VAAVGGRDVSGWFGERDVRREEFLSSFGDYLADGSSASPRFSSSDDILGAHDNLVLAV
jgi:hypothetical protein